MNTQQMMEEIDRLARLCEAKDSEIAFLQNCQYTSRITLRDVQVEFNKQLSEAQAQIAMKDDMFERIAALVLSNTSSQVLTIIDSALSATSETVAAWRAKETEQLRREVAMLHRCLDLYPQHFHDVFNPESECEICTARTITQATALAYEREVKAKALEAAAKSMQHRRFELPSDAHDELIEMAAELRASNKGEVR